MAESNMLRQRNEPQREKASSACIWFERYEMLEILGKGGMGTVYLARDIRLGRLIAMKILEQVSEQFREEVRVLQKQGLSMLPVIYDAWTEDDGCVGVIVMEYVEGQNLKEYLELHGQVSEKQIYSWGLQLGEFLQKLHSLHPKVLYRDLKPENIMVQPDGSLRLVDVGAAVCVGEENRRHGAGQYYEEKKKSYGIRVGTFGYASPEQWRGEKTDERTDIYSLGAVLWLMCVSRIKGADRGEINGGINIEISGIPKGMISVIRRCLREKKEKRFATAAAFLGAWKRYRQAGLRAALGDLLLKIGKYGVLLAAAYAIWLAPEGVWSRAGGYPQGWEEFWLPFSEYLQGYEKFCLNISGYWEDFGNLCAALNGFLADFGWHMVLPCCFAGYAVIKLIESISKKDWTGWEQEKSIWCRGWGP